MQRLNLRPCAASGARSHSRLSTSLASSSLRETHSSPSPHRCEAAAVSESTSTAAENGLKTASNVLPAPRAGQLARHATAYLEEHRIRSYEADPNQRTTMVTIANLLQEVAGNHGVVLWGRTETGFAADPVMVEQKLIFAATRIQIQMDTYPKWGDLVSIETWFQPEGRVCACRNWIIRDADTRKEIGRATSTWIMLNWNTRKLAKYPEAMREKMNYLAPRPPRHTLNAEEVKLKIPPVELPPEFEGPIQVARRSDMDMNGHINNVTYLAWALETVPMDIYLTYNLVQVETDYKAECMAGHKIESLACRVQEESNGTGIIRFVHTLRRCDSEGCVELVRARTTWKPDPSKLQKESSAPPALQ